MAIVQQLIDLTGNLPLAVSLIANVASYEGCDVALSRWKTESTRLLSDGYDKTSSLEISIMLSLSSARMNSGTKIAQPSLNAARWPLGCRASAERTTNFQYLEV
jgi:hypothetical protein